MKKKSFKALKWIQTTSRLFSRRNLSRGGNPIPGESIQTIKPRPTWWPSGPPPGWGRRAERSNLHEHNKSSRCLHLKQEAKKQPLWHHFQDTGVFHCTEVKAVLWCHDVKRSVNSWRLNSCCSTSWRLNAPVGLLHSGLPVTGESDTWC